jgi:RND superfamily putative drug exporter
MLEGKDRHDAVLEAVTTAGRSVILAGATVVIAVLGLALTGLPYMYGVAIAASLAVLVVMLASVTLLPAFLSYLGPRVNRLRLPLLSRKRSRWRAAASRPRPGGRIGPAPAVAGGARSRSRSCSPSRFRPSTCAWASRTPATIPPAR